MVFQGKINVSPAVQFTVTVTRTLLVKTDGIYMYTYVNSDDSCIYNEHTRAQNKGSYVEKNWDRGWFIHLRVIHTLTWLNFDYHWSCVWFGSCENRRLTRRTPKPLQIKWVELYWVKRRTSHEPWIGFGSCEVRRLTRALLKIFL